MNTTLIDPGPESLALLASLGLDVVLQTEPLPDRAPLLRGTRARSTPLHPNRLSTASTAALWRVHDEAFGGATGGGATLWQLKLELARRLFRDCRLCGWGCGVDRERGEHGRCGLGPDASPAPMSVHVGEEALINPSLLAPVRGCALRCRGCQQWQLLSPGTPGALDPLGTNLPESHRSLARTLSFIGGNPDESLPAILEALDRTDSDHLLPVVWNTHAWVPRASVDLLRGVVDTWVPDLKYGDDRCALAISRVSDYVATVRSAIGAMADQGIPVVVRHLVLPGHFTCCTLPTLTWLAASGLREVTLSLLQYTPDWRALGEASPLGEQTTLGRVEEARNHALRLGLELARPGLVAQIPSARRGLPVLAIEERDGPAPAERP